jgi:uncharacterized protein YbaR (Trm112 family)
VSQVFDDLLCPECGGRIGGGDGHRPCTCFKQASASTRPRPGGSDETPPYDHGPQASARPGTSGRAAQKLCRVCGKDLTGKPRLRDKQGYLCKACSDAEDDKSAQTLTCPECHRKLRIAGFIDYRGTLICKSCHSHHQETDKVKVARVDTSYHDREEKQKLYRLLILLGVISLFLVGNLMYWLL